MIAYILVLIVGIALGYAYKAKIATAVTAVETTVEEDVKAFNELEAKIGDKAKQILSTLKDDEKALVQKYLALKSKLGK